MRFLEEELSQPKRYVRGTHRACEPSETLRRWLPRMHLFGITRLANLTGLDHIGLPVYTAIRPNSRSLSTSQGKGLDAEAAKASALMESIETWHGERIDKALRHESFLNLCESAPVADLFKLPLKASARLHPELPMLWIEGYDLLQQRRAWVPFECVTTNCVVVPGHATTFPVTSNGLASGNHLLEALSHALAEVIERDALTTFWHQWGREVVKARQVDPSTITSAPCLEILDKLSRAEVEVAIWDVRADARLPVFQCEIFESVERPTWRRLGVFAGYGCHLCPEIALLRALTEAIQSRLAFIAGSRDDLFPERYLRTSTPEHLKALLEQVRNPPPPLAFEPTSFATDSFEGDVEVLLDGLRRRGITQAIAVDLSKPEFQIPVVKVVVPGLRGYAPPQPRTGSSRRRDEPRRHE